MSKARDCRYSQTTEGDTEGTIESVLLKGMFEKWGWTPAGGGVLGLMFAGYVPLVSQSPYPIIVYFWVNYRPHLSHFLEM